MVLCCINLTQEAERTDDRRLLRLAVADGEEADNADDQQHKCQYAAQDRHNNGEAQQQRHNAEQNIHNAELERLTNVERRIRRIMAAEQRENNAERTHQVAKHGNDLVFRNILGCETQPCGHMGRTTAAVPDTAAADRSAAAKPADTAAGSAAQTPACSAAAAQARSMRRRTPDRTWRCRLPVHRTWDSFS